MKALLHFCAILALALIPAWAGTTPTDGGYWDSRFNTMSSRATVDVTADDNRRLLVWGQSLPVASPLPGNTSVARWDGRKWEVLAKTVVPAVVVARGNQVFAGGKFSSINGVAATNIAVLENGAWAPLAEGVNSNVTSIAFLGTNLIAGGSFTRAGSVTTPSIALWNGAAWSAMGAGLTVVVSRVATSIDTAYAAWTSGSNTVISLWNGSDWQQLGMFSMSDGSAANVRALRFVEGALFAGGRFNSLDGQAITNIARWDGAAWTQWAGSKIQGQVESFTSAASKIYASGDLVEVTETATNRFALAQIREGDFTKELNGEAKFGRTTASIGSEVFVVTQPFLPPLVATEQNFFYDTSGLIWHFSGDAWGLVSNIPQSLPVFREMADSPEGLIAAVTPHLGVINPLVWTGNRFEVTTIEPQPAGARLEIKNLLVQKGASVYAQATQFKSGEPSRDLLVCLSNRVWRAATLPIDGQFTALGLYNEKIAASVRTVDTTDHWNIWLWDGAQWTNIGGDFNGIIISIASFNGELYAAGRPLHSGTTPINRLARFDGTKWISVGNGIAGPVEPLVVQLLPVADRLYVGGIFEQAGGIQATNLATWDGTNWQPVPGLTNGAIMTMAASSDGLIAIGGSFRYIAGLDAGGVAFLDGAQWSTLGTNISGSNGFNVIDLLWRDHDLFAGGSFNSFNGTLSQNFGIWHHPGVVLASRFSTNGYMTVTTTGAVPNSFSLEETTDFSTWTSLGESSIGNDRPWIIAPANARGFVRAKLGN